MNDRVVLVVDDSPTMRRLISFALGRVPAVRFLEADDGARALVVVQQQAVDLVLLDINMPILGGFGFLEKLSTVPEAARPRVVVITTEGAQKDIAHARGLGAYGYVTKPIQAASLVAVVRQALGLGVGQVA